MHPALKTIYDILDKHHGLHSRCVTVTTERSFKFKFLFEAFELKSSYNTVPPTSLDWFNANKLAINKSQSLLLSSSSIAMQFLKIRHTFNIILVFLKKRTTLCS